MPSISTYVAEIDLQSSGDAITTIQAESAQDAEALLEFLCEHDAVGIDIKLKISTFKTQVEVSPSRRITAYIQADGAQSAAKLFRAMYGPDNIGRVSAA